MTTLRTVAIAAVACSAVAGLFLGAGHAAGTGKASPPAPPLDPPGRLVVHEWGTFTSFSGSDGVPVGFEPDNSDLPGFVYRQEDEASKSRRLRVAGTVSMETPVIYFYADAPTRVSARVDFPLGWITEWYPFAAKAPTRSPKPGQTIRWDVQLLAGGPVSFPKDRDASRYYQARETDALPLQAEVEIPRERRDTELRGAAVVQRERFLFYRGVGTFPPPVAVRAVGGGRLTVKNTTGGTVGGLVVVSARGGKVGFRPLAELSPGAEASAAVPEPTGGTKELAAFMVRELTAAGLYEKEAQAMVATWDSAWFGEDGTRVLYLVPRPRTDELLPLAVEPKPTEVVRVLVGRHDFLTPEQESDVDRQVRRVREARAELEAAEAELNRVGRFSPEARRLAEKRMDARPGGR